jgi:hypothetical protein
MIAELDLLLLKPPRDFYRKRHPLPKDVFLLVEFSDASLGKDQGIKLPAYARAGWKTKSFDVGFLRCLL